MTPRIYLDNAATSWPKPPGVYEAVEHFQRDLGAPAGRGAYRHANEVERLLNDARHRIAQLINADDPRRVIFTFNGTDSLNLALHGILRPGDHVVTTVLEHNSVLRPLRWLEEHRDVAVTRIPSDAAGVVDPDEVRRAIRPNTRLVAAIHVSNVTGAIQPVEEICEIAHAAGALTLVDAAQSLGHLPIDVQAAGTDLLAAPGHKGLLGPLGTGVLFVASGVETQLAPLRQGGTGTHSEEDRQPDSLPDKFEAGNHNMAGIAGLCASVSYLQKRGVNEIRRHEQQLTKRLLDGLREIAGVTILGPANAERQLGVVSVTLDGYDPQEVAAMLDASHGVQVRAGMHCAPLAHRALGTAALGGTIRFSPGALNSETAVEVAIESLAEIASTVVDV